MASASDDFARTDNGTDLGSASWTANIGVWKISSNRAGPNTGDDSVATWNADSFGNNQFSQVTLNTLMNGADGDQCGPGVGVRWSSDATKTGFWCVATNFITGLNTVVSRFIAGAYTPLQQASIPWANGDVMRMEISGSSGAIQILIKRNGVTVITLTNQTGPDSGRVGLAFSASSPNDVWVDDWTGGDLEIPSPTFPPFPNRIQPY